MKMHKKTFPVSSLFSLKPKIDPTPDYQRPPAWTRKQKQLLIDSILREYDIPKMYWREVERDDGVKFEVIDGQQRLRTIWEFRDNDYPLARDADPIDGAQIAGLRYADLDTDQTIAFDSYNVDVVIITEAIETDEEDEVRDMFLRLQNGTTLKAQEKRNAMPGQMRDFIREIAGHPFFTNCKFSNSRYTFDHVAAQIVCLELAGGPTNVRDSDLTRMYRDGTKFDASLPQARKVRRVLDFLGRAFPEKTPELERYNVITLYCLVSRLLQAYVHDGLEESLHDWFIDFEKRRREEDALPEDDRDPKLIEYKRLTSYSTDTEESIRGRLDLLEARFFEAEPDIELKDPTRTFSHEQRLAIWRSSDRTCQVRMKCDGVLLTWDDWHADHVVPHTRGGKTTVANGQVACAACNWAKGPN